MSKTRPAYPEEFRREALHMLRVGRTLRELAESLGRVRADAQGRRGDGWRSAQPHLIEIRTQATITRDQRDRRPRTLAALKQPVVSAARDPGYAKAVMGVRWVAGSRQQAVPGANRKVILAGVRNGRARRWPVDT